MCDFRGRSILVDLKKKKSLPTDPNFEDHAIRNTHIFLFGLTLIYDLTAEEKIINKLQLNIIELSMNPSKEFNRYNEAIIKSHCENYNRMDIAPDLVLIKLKWGEGKRRIFVILGVFFPKKFWS